MIVRIIAPAPDGTSLPVIIVSDDRAAFVSLVDKLRSKTWSGRLLYYEGSFKGGVDVRIDGKPDLHLPYSATWARKGTWGEFTRYTGAGLAEFIRRLFNENPLQDLRHESNSDPDIPIIRSAALALPRPASKGNPQMSLF